MSAFVPYAEYVGSADIIYVRLRDRPIVRTLTLGHWRNIDLDATGEVVAAEFIDVTHEGLDLSGVPERNTIEHLIRAAGISLASTLST